MALNKRERAKQIVKKLNQKSKLDKTPSQAHIFSPSVKTGGGITPPIPPVSKTVQNKTSNGEGTPEDETIKSVEADAKSYVNYSLRFVKQAKQKKLKAQKINIAYQNNKAPPAPKAVPYSAIESASEAIKNNVKKYAVTKDREKTHHTNISDVSVSNNTKFVSANTPPKLSNNVRIEHGAVYQHRKIAGRNNVSNDISHGTARKDTPLIKTASSKTRSWNSFSHTNATSPAAATVPIESAKKALHRKNTAARATAKAAKKSAKSAKAAIKAVKNAGKAASKSAALAAKVLIPVSIGALPIILIILLVIIIMAVISTPIGTLFSGSSEDSPVKINDMVTKIGGEWANELAATRERYESQGYKVEVNYGLAGVGDLGSRVNNWKDCLALHSVYTNDGEQATNIFKPEDERPIRDLYFDMNPISVETRVEVVESEVEVDKEVIKKVWNPVTKKYDEVKSTEKVTEVVQEEIKIADITVQNKRWNQMLGEYPLSEEEQGYVKFMLKAENNALWEKMGIYNSIMPGGGFNGNISDIIKDLPAGQLGSAIVEIALSRLGDPYVLGGRDAPGGYVDCSGLTQWAYAQVGINIPWTAAEQARWCVDNGRVVDPSAAVPGDLIFWSYPNSGRVSNRFMAIGHVAIYAGNGMMVEAAPSAGCVTYRAVSVQGTPILYGRAHI